MDTTGAMALPDAAGAASALHTDVLEFKVPSQPQMISEARRRIRKFANSMPFTTDQLDDIGVAVGEAVTNAVKYGRGKNGHDEVRIKANRLQDRLRIRISDAGPGFDPSKVCPPCIGDLSECGRGLMCMSALMDEVCFHHLHPGMCVEMVKRLTD